MDHKKLCAVIGTGRQAIRLTNAIKPDLANQDMENFARIIKNNTHKNGGIIIDSSAKEPDIIAQEIIDLLQNKR